MRAANLLVPPEPAGEVVLLDFDDCGWGWFLYDLGAALSFVEDSPRVPELVDAWVRGYRAEAALSAAEEAELDTFVLLRRLLLVAWLGSHPDADLARTLGAAFTAASCELAETYLTRRGSDRSWPGRCGGQPPAPKDVEPDDLPARQRDLPPAVRQRLDEQQTAAALRRQRRLPRLEMGGLVVVRDLDVDAVRQQVNGHARGRRRVHDGVRDELAEQERDGVDELRPRASARGWRGRRRGRRRRTTAAPGTPRRPVAP